MKNKNIVAISIPLVGEEVDKYYMKTQDYHFRIIVNKSMTLTPKQFINYLANFNMKHFDLILDSAPDEYVTELIKEYIKTNRQVSIPIFNKIIINALEDIIMHTKNPVNKDFVDNNFELLNEVINVLYNLKFATDIMIAGDEYDNDILKLEPASSEQVGTNIISLRHEEEFWNLFILLEFARTKLNYYKMFTETSIKGYSMIYFMVNEKNPVGVAVRNMQEDFKDVH